MARTTNPARLGEAGIALPLALLGLVAVTLMVTTAVLTSSTEVALGLAHQDGVSSLYQADSGLEEVVARQAAITAGPGFIANAAAVSETYRSSDGLSDVVVKRLQKFDVIPPPDAAGQMATRTELFSLIASPVSGRGRSVGAFLRATRQVQPVRFNVRAGAISGGDVRVRGGAELVDHSALCVDEHGNVIEGDAAIQMTEGGVLNAQGNSYTIDGDVENLDVTADQLPAYLFGPGMTIDMVAEMYGTLRIDGNVAQRSNHSNSLTSPDSLYNWGCPTRMEIVGCDTSRYNGRYETIVIDASYNNGEVTINGDHGQGMLIVINGSLRLQGNFKFKGMILVEEDIRVGGTGGSFSGKIEGSVVALGSGSQIEDRYEGGAVIHYNQCANDQAMQGLTERALDREPQTVSARTFGWFEHLP